MNKKGFIKILDIIFVLGTLLLVFFSYRAFRAGSVPPQSAPFTAVTGLMIPGLLAACLGAALYWLIRRKWVLMVLSLAAIALQYNYISGVYRFGGNKNVPEYGKTDPGNLKIGTLNAHNFGRDDKIHNVKSIAYFFDQEQADIVCLQEYSDIYKFGEDSIAKIFKENHYPYYALGRDSAHSADIAIFSRFPIADSGFSKFSDSNADYLWADIVRIPGGTAGARTAPAEKIRVINVHLESTGISETQMEMAQRKKYTGSLNESMMTRRAVARLEWSFIKRSLQIAELIPMIRKSPYPVILCGDFNDTPASYAYNNITEYLTDGFKDCGRGYGYTYKYFRKLLRIDYIFYGKEFKGVAYKSPDKSWSDHNPVLIELDFSERKN